MCSADQTVKLADRKRRNRHQSAAIDLPKRIDLATGHLLICLDDSCLSICQIVFAPQATAAPIED